MIRSDINIISMSNFNVEDVEDAKTRLISVKSKSELTKRLAKQVKNRYVGIQGIVGKDQRATCWSTIW